MSNHITLFNNVMRFVLENGLRLGDLRLQSTFVWAIVGLLISESISLSQWALFRPGHRKAASKLRQLSRWLHNNRIEPRLVFRPFVRCLLAEWVGKEVYLALDTSQLWQQFTVVRLALVYRGRALPLAWQVLVSGSAIVRLTHYHHLLAEIATLLPTDSRVILLADRGFFDVELLKVLRDLGWHFRLRLKSSLWVYRANKGRRKVSALMPSAGEARFLAGIWVSQQRFGPLHLALAHVRTSDGYERWAILSDEAVGLQTLDEYGLRFDIEENFLDDKSAGFDLESSLLRDAAALSRLCLILALTTIYLVSTGTAITELGRRHWIDTHWRRGLSYFQIGWRWVKLAHCLGQRLIDRLWLTPGPDPEPAIACWRQFHQPDLYLSRIHWL